MSDRARCSCNELPRMPIPQRFSRYNGSGPGGAGNTTRGLTRSLDLRKEGLMPKRTRSNDGSDRKR